MILTIFRKALEAGVDIISLEVRKSNLIAQELYRQFEFHQGGSQTPLLCGQPGGCSGYVSFRAHYNQTGVANDHITDLGHKIVAAMVPNLELELPPGPGRRENLFLDLGYLIQISILHGQYGYFIQGRTKRTRFLYPGTFYFTKPGSCPDFTLTYWPTLKSPTLTKTQVARRLRLLLQVTPRLLPPEYVPGPA
ncbi:hypothetical protein HKBW3S06_00145, partial [Candidatus Hakubella thermalkaliphila]